MNFRSKLYFVKADVQACFDTIEQAKLLGILKSLISEVRAPVVGIITLVSLKGITFLYHRKLTWFKNMAKLFIPRER